LANKLEALNNLIEVGEMLRNKLLAMACNDVRLWRYVEEWDQSRKEYEETE